MELSEQLMDIYKECCQELISNHDTFKNSFDDIISAARYTLILEIMRDLLNVPDEELKLIYDEYVELHRKCVE